MQKRVPLLLFSLFVCFLVPEPAFTQQLTGTLIGTVKDEQGGVLPGATVTVSSPSLFGGALTAATNEWGQLRFPVLPPGRYSLAVVLQGFAPYREDDIAIGAGSTIERSVVLALAGIA
ncbi:MAG: carboxypeptidase regulatory-like domain-containing protein [Acidobacteria bacterium]|nr:carboxypeptidase regulatory-like domain-containing protein [Acidobacteriota bacterium]